MEKTVVFLVCFLLVHHARPLEWSPQSLAENSTVYACIGRDLALPWVVNHGPGEEIVDIQWNFLGHSDEMIALFSHGNFIPLPAYSGGRVDFTPNAGIVVHHVTWADVGTYSLEVNAHGEDGSSFLNLTSGVVVTVAGDLLTTDGAVHIQLNETAVYDSASDEFHVILKCGHFIHSTVPPFDVEWQLPDGQKVSSTSYSDGQFYLQLENPVAGGQYTCRVPLTSAQYSCVHHDVESTLTVDKVDVRLTLLEAENNHLKALLKGNDTNNGTPSRHVSFDAGASISPYSVGQVVRFVTVKNNQGNAFNESSHQFTVPYDGTYFFIVTTTTSTSGSYGNVEIVVDHTLACRIHSYIPHNTGTCQTVVDLNVGQKVWVRAFTNSGQITHESSFSGFLINTRS